MDTLNTLNNNKDIIEKIMQDVDDVNRPLYEYFTIVSGLENYMVKLSPIKLIKLLAEYPVHYLTINTLKTKYYSRLIFLKKEYNSWKSEKYLIIAKQLEEQAKGKRILKDQIENTLNTTFSADITKYESEIDELTIKIEHLTGVLNIFRDIKYSFKGLSDMKEVWKPFVEQNVKDNLLQDVDLQQRTAIEQQVIQQQTIQENHKSNEILNNNNLQDNTLNTNPDLVGEPQTIHKL